MIDLDKAKLNPSDIFKHPRDVINEPSLTRQDKIDILQQWAYDEKEMAVAEEENMTSAANNQGKILDEILKLLLELGATDISSPTKQG